MNMVGPQSRFGRVVLFITSPLVGEVGPRFADRVGVFGEPRKLPPARFASILPHEGGGVFRNGRLTTFSAFRLAPTSSSLPPLSRTSARRARGSSPAKTARRRR